MTSSPHGGATFTLRRNAYRNLEDARLELELIEWISQTLCIREPGSLWRALTNGQLLCDLFNAFYPNDAIRPVHRKLEPFLMRENVLRFLQACRDVVEISDVELFDAEDLFQGKNSSRVLTSLVSFREHVTQQRRDAIMNRTDLALPPSEELHDHEFSQELESSFDEQDVSFHSFESVSSPSATLDNQRVESSVPSDLTPSKSPVYVRHSQGIDTDSTPERVSSSSERTPPRCGPHLSRDFASPTDAYRFLSESPQSWIEALLFGYRSQSIPTASDDLGFRDLFSEKDLRSFTFSCGGNSFGQCGSGYKSAIARPHPQHQSDVLRGENIVHCDAGSAHLAIVTESGRLVVCGRGLSGRLGLDVEEDVSSLTEVALPGRAVFVSCGAAHTIVLLESGRAVAFGYNASGQLGVGTGFDEFVCVPTFVDDSLVVESEGQDYRFRSVSCGFAHSIFLSESGRVYGCGSNGEGQLGIGLKHSLVWSPRHIAALTGNAWNRVTSVACGALHTLAVTIHGDVLGFGSNSMGLLSPDLSIDILDVPNTLERIAVRGGARAVYSGPFHSYAVLTSGSVVSWGKKSGYRLGVDHDDDASAFLRDSCLSPSSDLRSLASECVAEPQWIHELDAYEVLGMAVGHYHTLCWARPRVHSDVCVSESPPVFLIWGVSPLRALGDVVARTRPSILAHDPSLPPPCCAAAGEDFSFFVFQSAPST